MVMIAIVVVAFEVNVFFAFVPCLDGGLTVVLPVGVMMVRVAEVLRHLDVCRLIVESRVAFKVLGRGVGVATLGRVVVLVMVVLGLDTCALVIHDGAR